MHPVFLSSSEPPNGGKKVHSIEILEDDNVLYEVDKKKIVTGTKKFRLYTVVPRILDEWKLEKTIQTYCPPTWEKHFFESMSEIKFVEKFVEADLHIFPRKKNVFRAFYLCPLTQLKVVIVGPEPFEKSDNNDVAFANGLSFSTNKKASKLHPATANIYKELRKTIPEFKTPQHGDFEKWARQGILFLNHALTIRMGAKKSHYQEWSGFFHRTLLHIKEHAPNTIFVLWGSEAKSSAKFLEGKHILEAPNPAAYSGKYSFSNCGHFVQINTILQGLKIKPIDWCKI